MPQQNKSSGHQAPLSPAEVARLRADVQNIRATAHRKNVTLEPYEEQQETAAAAKHFELGCWLYYYSRRVYHTGAEGLKSRIDCARQIFLAGFTNPGYNFFTVFDFGERQFDTIFEMGDSDQVISALREHARKDRSGQIAQAFANYGWSLQ